MDALRGEHDAVHVLVFYVELLDHPRSRLRFGRVALPGGSVIMRLGLGVLAILETDTSPRARRTHNVTCVQAYSTLHTYYQIES